MQTLEEPVSLDWPVPPAGSEEYGQYVIVSYDPVASVAVLEDEEASRAAAALPRRKHLAVAISTGCISLRNADDVQRLTLEFHLMSEGLRPTEDGAYSIPVAPETTHPLDRPPIVPSIPLPWPNFYIETLSNFACIVSRIYYNPLKAYPCMVKEQRHQVLLYAIRDEKVSTERRLAAAFPGVAHPNGAVPLGDSRSEISRTDDSESSENVQDDDEEIAATYLKVEQVHIHVEIWTDLSSVDPHSLGRAADFFSQLEQVERITSNYESRTLARILSKPGTGDWVKSVTDAPQLLDEKSSVDPGITPDKDGNESHSVHGDSSQPSFADIVAAIEDRAHFPDPTAVCTADDHAPRIPDLRLAGDEDHAAYSREADPNASPAGVAKAIANNADNRVSRGTFCGHSRAFLARSVVTWRSVMSAVKRSFTGVPNGSVSSRNLGVR